ncbi:hypothetical protein PR048_000893 [Dryococelus australis]|uniref:Uncharacterized protein n=1 Tax=Dryococelus australis TaxID=614101 RepID=A0ABQ9IFW9_9NEOP|nr:hypothetical protein PR048_000893 [Dryococelus australis]
MTESDTFSQPVDPACEQDIQCKLGTELCILISDSTEDEVNLQDSYTAPSEEEQENSDECENIPTMETENTSNVFFCLLAVFECMPFSSY